VTEVSSVALSGASLGDESARQEIRTRLDSTIFVEAGAGSGKTTELVARIVELICTQTALLGEIAAITFTEAAAAELRARVRAELERVARAGSRDDLVAPGERESSAELAERAKRAAEAIDHIDEAVITTIHGFCHRILSEHPVEAGLPPRFEVLDEVRQSLAWKAEWESMVDALGDDEMGGRLFELAALLGIKNRRLEALARDVAVEWDACQTTRPDVEAVVDRARRVVEQVRQQLYEALERASAARSGCSDVNDRLFRLCEQAGGLGRLVRPGADWRDVLAVVSSKSFALGSANVGQAQLWGPEREVARQDLQLAMQYRKALVDEVSDLCLPALGALFDVFAREAAAERCRRGELLFHDLLVLARDVLLSDAGVRKAVRSKYRFLLVDEFQDTDPLQLEIAELIGRPVSAAAEPGRLFPVGDPEPGRLFRVGDPQQSIYRFRGADLEAYLAARERFVAGGGKVTTLTSNFRSVPGVLEFVNACFSGLLERFTPLSGVRDSLGEGASVHLLGGPFAERLKADDQRRREAEDCVATIRRAVFQGWLVGDDSVPGRSRAVRLGDIALLVPRRTGLGVIEELLDAAGIGYRIESAELIYRSQEVRELLALCRALDAPGERVALVSVLRSSLFRCGDDDLYEFRRIGGHFSLEDPLPEIAAPEAAPGAGRVVAAMACLGELRGRLGELGPVAAFELALRERRVLQLGACGPHPREAWRRVRFLTERLRAFVASGGGGLSEFADWVEDQLREGLRPVESVLPEPDEDVVRIMTVHGAKGLEFPVAILAGFGTTESSNQRPIVLRNAEGRCEVHFTNDIRTSGHASLYDLDRRLEAAEELRLLYVAATRARDHLVICAHHSEKAVPTPAERLFAVAHEAARTSPQLFDRAGTEADDGSPGKLARELLVTGEGATAAGPPGMNEGAGPAVPPREITEPEAYGRFLARRAELLEKLWRRSQVRATEVPGLAAIDVEAWELGDQSDDLAGAGGSAPTGRSGRRGRAGTQLGRAVHASLQSLNASDASALATANGGEGTATPSALESLARICAAQARAEHIGRRSAEVERLVLAALASPTVREAFASGRARRELYVSTSVGGIVLDGFVDLCFEAQDGGLVVVDYKTDAVTDQAEIDAKLARYELQVAAYALALGDATGLTVRRAVLVFLSPPAQPIEVAVAPLGALAKRVRGLLEAVAAR
jgi:ATP-dependent helicase/nuclease subunit A